MLYKFLRVVVRWALEIYFRKIYIHGLENIPDSRPVLLACNHPSAFMEACLLACYAKRPLHFLVRGDVFKPSLLWFFKATNQIPIYRFRDGFKNMRQNASTFDFCYKALQESKAIVVFPEGNTESEKRLRPLQKGTARIVFGSLDLYPDLDLCILPIGVNYTHPLHFRKEVMVQIGQPMEVAEYYSLYKENKKNGLETLTRDLEKKMYQKVIHVKKEDEELAEQLFEMSRSAHLDFSSKVVLQQNEKFVREKTIADQLFALEEEKKKQLNEKMGIYQKELSSLEQIDFSVAGNKMKNGLQSIALILGFIPMLFGLILNGIPVFLAQAISKWKVTLPEFFDPVRVTIALFFYLLFGMLLLIFGIFSPIRFLLLLLIPVFGYISLWWIDTYQNWTKVQKQNKLEKAKKSSFESMRKGIEDEFPYI